MSTTASHSPLNISETVSGETWFQRTTNRKWPMGNRMVIWPMTSRDLEGSSCHCRQPHWRLTPSLSLDGTLVYKLYCQKLETSCRYTTFRIADRTASHHIRYPIGHFLLAVLWNQASISNGFKDIERCMHRNCWHDLDLTSKKGQSH